MHLIRQCALHEIECDLFGASYQAPISPKALGVADQEKVGYAWLATYQGPWI